MDKETVVLSYDVIVVGSGGAGSAAAHAASRDGARVLVVTKDPIGCSDSKIAEGIVTVRGVAEESDSHEVLSDNLRLAGGDLPAPEITEAFAEDSEEAYDWLRRQGVRPRIDSKNGGPVVLPIALGGHSHRRSVSHDNGGLAVGHAAWNAVVQGDGVDYIEDAWFLDIVTEDGPEGPVVVGGLIYDAGEGCLITVQAPAVVIAAGGLSTLYFPNTDTMRGNTGDSYAVAARAGAELVDMEQVQFLPFCLTSPPSYEGLLAGEPVTAGYLGVIRGADGKVILDSVMLRTRAECAAAMVRAVEAGNGTENGGCYLDLTANVKGERSAKYYVKFVHTAVSGVMVTVRQALGRAAAEFKEIWEVRPGAHYCMGGVRVDAEGSAEALTNRQPVRGLFAAGQAMGGVFGGNRLGSTSLSEGPIFGARAGHKAAELRVKKTPEEKKSLSSEFEIALRSYLEVFGQEGDRSGSGMIRELQKAAWNGIGPARSRVGLERFLRQVADFRKQASSIAVSDESIWNQAFIDYVEFLNMLDTAEAVAVSALNRPNSLGAHIRMDGGNTSVLFTKPYSVGVFHAKSGALQTCKLDRPSTPWSTLLVHAYHGLKRRLELKVLWFLPLVLQDRIVEKKFRDVMGSLETERPEAERKVSNGEELEAA